MYDSLQSTRDTPIHLEERVEVKCKISKKKKKKNEEEKTTGIESLD
jgi:hypothetical protein